MCLVLGSSTVGYRIAADRVRPARPAATVVIEEVTLDAEQAEELPVRMPDVVGLTREEALEALADSGVDPSTVTFDERPFVGEAGHVVVQDPVRGQTEVDQVTLTLSSPATVPEVVGSPVDDAADAIEALGAVVVRRDVYAAGVADGSVVTVTPAAGAALAAEVVLEVAAPPSSVFLTSLEPVDGGCSTGTGSVNGTSSDAALSCSEGYDDEAAAGYDLGRRADRFRATAGISDAGDVGAQVRLRLVVDGAERLSVELAFGAATPIDIDVAGGLRLEIFVQDISPDNGGYDTPEAMLLDAALLGAPDAIAELGT